MISRFKSACAANPLVFLAAAFLIFSSNARAAGAPDPTFGAGNGRAVAAFAAEAAAARAVVVQPDGKILVVGDVRRAASQRDIALARFNPNGTPDLSFGESGRVVVAVSNRDDFAFAAALDADGKIVVVGSTQPPGDIIATDFLVARFTQAGALDPTFGSGGVTAFSQGSDDQFYAVAVLPSGRIIAAGGTSDAGQAAIAAFTRDGVVDRTFGDFGVNFFSLPGLNDERVQSIALLPNGRILVGGQGIATVPHPGTANFLAQFDSDGNEISGFGTGGLVAFWAGGIPFGFDLGVAPDGTILAVSDKLYRISSTGAVDANFGAGINGGEIAVRADGRIVVAHSTSRPGLPARILFSNGRLIGTDKNLTADDLAIQSDDKIIAVSSTETEFVVTRLLGITSQGNRLADYDGDERTDVAVLRQSNSTLYVLGSAVGFRPYLTGEASFEITRVIPEVFSAAFPQPLVYWRAGQLIGSPASFITSSPAGNRQAFRWGLNGDIPVGGDYDGDNRTDFAVYRPGDGTWYITQSSNNQLLAIRWGLPEDKPVPADYDYDGITDAAVYRPSNGTWYARRSSDDSLIAAQWGAASDIPLTGDFDGDGRADFVVFRPSEGIWYLLQTRGGFRAVQFGISADQPVPGDYDGDGRHDIAVFRQGFWYILGSTRGFYAVQWGVPNDVPVAVRYAY